MPSSEAIEPKPDLPHACTVATGVPAVQFFRFYMGIYKVPFPEAVVSVFPQAHFSGSRVHISGDCSTAAVAYTSASYTLYPPGAATATLQFANATVWYSSAPALQAEEVVGAAEVARDAAADVLYAYGADVSPYGGTAVSSERGSIREVRMHGAHACRAGAPLDTCVQPSGQILTTATSASSHRSPVQQCMVMHAHVWHPMFRAPWA